MPNQLYKACLCVSDPAENGALPRGVFLARLLVLVRQWTSTLDVVRSGLFVEVTPRRRPVADASRHAAEICKQGGYLHTTLWHKEVSAEILSSWLSGRNAWSSNLRWKSVKSVDLGESPSCDLEKVGDGREQNKRVSLCLIMFSFIGYSPQLTDQRGEVVSAREQVSAAWSLRMNLLLFLLPGHNVIIIFNNFLYVQHVNVSLYGVNTWKCSFKHACCMFPFWQSLYACTHAQREIKRVTIFCLFLTTWQDSGCLA